MISIIIVSLNTKDDFLKTLNSIISQTEEVEVIGVDGGSTDGTTMEIKKNSKFFNKIIIEKDEGIYFAMNKGIKQASKEWIYFLNSGDIFYNDKTIKNIIEILKIYKKSDVVIGNSLVKRNNNIVTSKRSKIDDNTVNSCFSHQSTFTKRYLLEMYPFDTEFKYASDFNFFLKLFKLGKKFIYIDNFISINKYGGISDLNRIKVFLEFRKITMRENKNLVNLLKINLLILFNFFKKIIKITLPNLVIEKIIFLSKKNNN